MRRVGTRDFVFLVVIWLVGCGQAEETAVLPTAPTPTIAGLATVAATETAVVVPSTAVATPIPATSTVAPAVPTVIPTLVSEAETAVAPTPNPFAELPGALIQVSMQSQVGILLDEIPPDLRDAVVADLMTQAEETWLARATRQVRLTRLRLNFRQFGAEDKGQLPLPPESLWNLKLDEGEPTRQMIQGHDVLLRGYTFDTVLLTGADDPALAEPNLAEMGGVWEEHFVLPIDPDLLLQRTGNACINEGGFPPNSFDSENIWHFYDFSCEADSGGATGCHRTQLPQLSCREALAAGVGEASPDSGTTAVRFERLPWSAELADQVRVGELTSPNTPDLKVVADDLATNRIVYRYIEADDCALEEGGVGGSGWRRLLQFDATVANVGGQPLEIGEATVEDLDNHVFIYSPCHDHFHYSNYGNFFVQADAAFLGSKRAFCVQSTSRLGNNEATPLTHDYSCRTQGIQTGWVDEYIAGLDAQWVDITDLAVPPEGTAVQLGFRSNGDRFLCEGTAVLDENGDKVWEPSGLTDSDGHSFNRPQCDFIPDWEVGNEATREVFVPPIGSFVTAPCQNDEISPLRNCGFTEVELNDADVACTPGAPVSLALSEVETPLVVRVCERSGVLGMGVACTFSDSLLNVVATSAADTFGFVCPPLRDGTADEGGYALYTAPLSVGLGEG